MFFNISLLTASDCPQPRNIALAPDDIYNKRNPLKKTSDNLTGGKKLFHEGDGSLACMQCHGVNGDGHGEMREDLASVPRNFTCKKTMQKISDGQMFWVIKNGSPNLIMPGYGSLSDKKIWQVILYIREFAK